MPDSGPPDLPMTAQAWAPGNVGPVRGIQDTERIPYWAK